MYLHVSTYMYKISMCTYNTSMCLSCHTELNKEPSVILPFKNSWKFILSDLGLNNDCAIINEINRILEVNCMCVFLYYDSQLPFQNERIVIENRAKVEHISTRMFIIIYIIVIIASC